ncbi:MAG: methionine--tRNA ligase [Candidatus Bathyarchaeota archaeon]|nr:methionine--tRNA ligase [Candidatus Bathyarchaeota archaeon]
MLENIIVTTGLIYANGEIHLGHITSTYLPADIFVRFCKLRGDNIIHVGATDDFGTPILVEAERRGVSPEEIVAYWNKKDLEDFGDLGIHFDIYYKTSSTENLELTQHFFKKLYEKGHIYRKVIDQPYCQNCGKFLPDRYVLGTCPRCGATEQYSDSCEKCGRTFQPGEILEAHCAICGSKPQKKESEHYFFKLGSFSDRLEKWLLENKNLQSEVRNYVLNWVGEGLKDWDISRDLAWGVPVPLKEAKGKVLYVWFNNHIAYISTALKYFKEKGIDGKEAWNSSRIYHFIGKDIVYHHYLFMPALRMGVEEFKLPDFIPTRGHFNLEGQKFSKSREWYISVRQFLNEFPGDYLRYYLAAITPYSQSDVDFQWEDFQKRINNELIAKVGNFIHRVLSFLWSNYRGVVPEPGDFDKLDRELKRKLEQVVEDAAEEIDGLELSKGLRKIVDFSAFCNQYFQQKHPWTDKQKAKTALYLCANLVRSFAILLEPYIPTSAENLWKQLNLSGSVHNQNWNSASELTINSSHKICKPTVLFKRVEDKDVDREKGKLPVRNK